MVQLVSDIEAVDSIPLLEGGVRILNLGLDTLLDSWMLLKRNKGFSLNNIWNLYMLQNKDLRSTQV